MVLLVGVGVPRIALRAGQNWTVHRQGPRGPFSNVSTACESPCDIDWNSFDGVGINSSWVRLYVYGAEELLRYGTQFDA